ncbi:MAG: hypothetical protein H6830_00265 [Planctomycetes bacterium]|nr:hypothetical protein [Planctomycetota bacterium]MCB9910768.1 hypothetical protein [Planctomycetota bacterium]MCB9912794.1 hypothetical protein [Planctomycetota bacterium]HPF13186.1 hypothetical protein [Planctomycetota bacterium]HRV82927.1 hypothetical protein [Planctomycetota bacterium]
MTSEKVYDALNSAKTADRVQIVLKSGKAIAGSLVFNPLKGSVRIIDIDQETSVDFGIDQIAELKFL